MSYELSGLGLKLLGEYDKAVEEVLLADAAGMEDPLELLHHLDEVRGRAWASYTPLKDALAESRGALESGLLVTEADDLSLLTTFERSLIRHRFGLGNAVKYGVEKLAAMWNMDVAELRVQTAVAVVRVTDQRESARR